MMDGQVKEIRKQLDENGYKQVKIMSYSAKYASNFYGPFRIAARSSPVFGDRKSYQMDFRNLKQALEEIKEDIREGADIVMVKPGNLYADVIYAAKKQFKNIPIAAYQVSGEYMMIKLLAKNGLINELDGFFESLICLKRAGADYIISYYAKEIAKWLKN
jgi:porphobilinogen synthase